MHKVSENKFTMVTKHEDDAVDLQQLMSDTQDILQLNIGHHHLDELADISILSPNSYPVTFADFSLSPTVPQDESTMDIAEKCKRFIFEHKYGPPDRGSYSGELKFEVQVNASDINKKRYLYSSKLNRIYVNIDVNFSIRFQWDFLNAPLPMYVRATTVFSDEAQAQKRVDRCLQHKHATNAGSEPLLSHVLRSTRDINTQGVFYCGDTHRPDSWYSVLVEFPALPHDGSPAFSHAYQFACKNSCSTGINRRAIDIVFTLEDQSGKIYGRQTVGARVCSCPRRDMMKDEECEGSFLPGKKRVSSNRIEASNNPTKKIKVEVKDDLDTVYTLPAGIQIVGAKTLTTSLGVMLSMMEQVSSLKKNDAAAQEKYSKAIASVRNVLDQFKPQ